jgi:hypothetical protein
MCPVCMTTLALVTAGLTSAGGITTLVVRSLRDQNDEKHQGERHGQEQGERQGAQ